jgi:hypothetical protein
MQSYENLNKTIVKKAQCLSDSYKEREKLLEKQIRESREVEFVINLFLFYFLSQKRNLLIFNIIYF